jgi:Zn finger protein HypA/HybF involved in hydrogenase expression
MYCKHCNKPINKNTVKSQKMKSSCNKCFNINNKINNIRRFNKNKSKAKRNNIQNKIDIIYNYN